MRYRTLLLATLALALPLSLAAQEQTLIGSGRIDHGGYGAPVFKVTSVNGEAAVLAGGRGGWIINHRFVVGGGGYGLTTSVDSRMFGPLGERYIDFGYGGLILEYVINSDRLVHSSVELLIGGGGITHREQDGWHYGGEHNYRDDAVSVIEPGANMDLNITSWFRLSGGLSYRFVGGARLGMATSADLSAFAGSLALRFGKF